MKKFFLRIFWLDFFVIMVTPLLLIFSARFNRYDIFDHIAGWAMLWLLAAFIFIVFAVVLGARVKSFPATPAQQAKNSKAILSVALFSLLGIFLSFLRTVFSSEHFWDIMVLYWIIFVVFLSRKMKEFIALSQYDAPCG